MLDYFALGLLVFVALVLFYGIIAIHDIPYEIAKARQHPQQDAIHIAGWISLFTLHTIWPFLWIWATLYRSDRGWGFLKESEEKKEITELLEQVLHVNDRIHAIETENKASLTSQNNLVHALQTRIEAIESKESKESKDHKETP